MGTCKNTACGSENWRNYFGKQLGIVDIHTLWLSDAAPTYMCNRQALPHVRNTWISMFTAAFFIIAKKTGKKEKNGGKKVFDDIMTNSFSELMKGTNAQDQES